jgi:four helix bundle protein
MEKQKQTAIASYRDLRIYQRSYDLALEIHKITLKFPVQERWELGSQLRRAATSVPINIAEGYGRKISPEDFKRFLVIALGSNNEVNVILDLVRDLGYLQEDQHKRLAQENTEIGKGINKLIQVWR